MTERRNAWAHGRCVRRQKELEAQIAQLQGRLDAAVAKLDETTAESPRADTAELRAILTGARTALRGDQATETRELFGRTIPEYVLTERCPKWTELICLRPHTRGNGPWKALVYHTGTALELDHLDKFLAMHVHERGKSAEPDVTPPDPCCDACGRPRMDPRHTPGPFGHPYRARGGCDGECPDGSRCPCEPAVTPPDPSGRIRDNGLVEPFRPDDTEVSGA